MSNSLKFYIQTFLILFLVLKTITELCAQKIIGKYHSDRDSFAPQIEPYYQIGFQIISPCQGGFCIVDYGYEGKGIIDTSGNIIQAFEGGVKSISIHATPHAVYKNYIKWDGDCELSRLKGEALNIKSKKPYIYLSSDSSGDYFYIENYTSSIGRQEITYGDIILIGKDSISNIGKDLAFNHSGLSNQVLAEKYFLRGLLITPKKDGLITIQDFRFQKLFSEMQITDLTKLNEIVFIVRSANSYNLIRASDPRNPIDSFDSYSIQNWSYTCIIYRKKSKYGVYVCGLQNTKFDDSIDMLNFHKIEAVYDSIYIEPINNNYLQLFKGDTLLNYYYLSYNELPVTKPYFYEAFKIRNSGKIRQIGAYGRYFSEDRRKLTKYDLIPNTFLLGNNWTRMNYLNVNQPDTFEVFATSLEVGFGWYDYTIDDYKLFSGFDLAGGGLSLEFRMPFANPGKFKEKTGKKYQHLFLNARMEFSAGLAVGNLGIGLNLQMAYSTNLIHHYVRPGIGLSTLNVQIGMELYIPASQDIFKQYWMGGYYIRYLFLEDLY